MKTFFIILYISFSMITFGQKRKTYFPVWTFQQKNTTINGISFGLWDYELKPKFTKTNGIQISLIGEGIILPIAVAPFPKNDSVFKIQKNIAISHKINGINIAGTGTMGDCSINGLSLGFIGQGINKMNGLSAVVMLNIANEYNGIQIAGMGNQSYKMNGIQIGIVNVAHKMNGIQIGLYNESVHTRGIQIGLKNKNEKRQTPIINWNFSD